MIILLCVAAWLVCGFISAGFDLAYFQREWPNQAKDDWQKDLHESWIGFIFGPIHMIILFFHMRNFFKHGWMLPFGKYRK